jgi:hypothetical protein
MYPPKKQRDYRNLWLISMALLVIGIVLTVNLAVIRPAGFALLGIGGVGIVWSLTRMDRWKDNNDDDRPPRQFR